LVSRADRVLREIELASEKEFFPIVGHDRGRVLVQVLRRTRPKRVLEVGTLVGYSAILMAKNLDSDARLVTIEIDTEEAEIAKKNIAQANLAHIIQVIVGDAKKVIPRLRGKFDFVFIDAEKTEYLDYLKAVESHLHKGSVVVADNAGRFAKEMKNYLTYVRSSGRYESRYRQIGDDGLEISGKL